MVVVDRKSTIVEQERWRPKIQEWDRQMTVSTRAIVSAAFLVAPALAFSTPAEAGVGDLLVAPTRVILDGGRGAEIILNNIGDEPATYRVSIEFLKMDGNGKLADVPTPTADQLKAEDMIVYSPR